MNSSMNSNSAPPSSASTGEWIAFAGLHRLASGAPRVVAGAVKEWSASHDEAALVFDACTSELVELDLRGALADVLARVPETNPVAADEAPAALVARTPGRPKLGVVAREVTLLPRHWDWLQAQSGGASVALRKLVEQSMRERAESERRRRAQESAYRFMSALAGDLPGYEEVARALFADDLPRLQALLREWPADVGEHVLRLARSA